MEKNYPFKFSRQLFFTVMLIVAMLPIHLVMAQQLIEGRPIKKGVWRNQEIEYVDGQILVKLKQNAQKQALMAVLSQYQATLLYDFNKLRWGLIELPEGADIFPIIAVLQSNSSVEAVEPHGVLHGSFDPNDPNYLNGLQWALKNTGQSPPGGTNDADIDAPEAWDITLGSSNIIIAILDSGIPMLNGSLSHPDLDDPNKIILGSDYANDGEGVRDLSGHGTHVAGIAAAETNNSTGIAGVAGACKIRIIQVFNAFLSASPLWFQSGVTEAVNNGAKVINFSGGTFTASPPLEDAVEYAYNNNVIIISTTGNDCGAKHGLPGITYPAKYSSSYSNVIAVSATNYHDMTPEYSNIGPEVNVAAPGGNATSGPGGTCDKGGVTVYDADDVYSTTPNYPFNIQVTNPEVTQNYGYLAGTSMAAPHVAGLAALILSLNQALVPSQVRDIIQQTADDKGATGRDDYYGYGRINAYKALLLTLAYSNKSVSSTATGWGSTQKSVYTTNNSRWHQIFQTNGQIAYAYSTNDGSSWQGHQFINGAVNVSTSSNPALSTRSNFLYSVFSSAQETDGFYRIYFNRNSSGNWLTTPLLLYSAGAEISYLSFAIEATSGTGHMVWVEGAQALLATSTLKHGTFNVDAGTPVLSNITTVYTTSTATITNPALTLDGTNKPHAVWSVSNEIRYSNKTGSNWSSSIKISNTSGVSQYPSVLYNPSTSKLGAVWHNNSTGNNEIWYRERTGSSWGAFQNLSNSSASSTYPFIGGPINSAAVVLWVENVSGNNEIKYTWVGQSDTGLFATTTGSSLYPTFTFRVNGASTRVLGLWTEGSSSPYLVEDGYKDFTPLLPKLVAEKDLPEILPKEFALYQNHPNPFNPTTTIRYALPKSERMSLRIFSLLGQGIRTLVDEQKAAGDYEAVWDGRDNNGRFVSSGVYVYRLEAGNFSDTKKLVLLQ